MYRNSARPNGPICKRAIVPANPMGQRLNRSPFTTVYKCPLVPLYMYTSVILVWLYLSTCPCYLQLCASACLHLTHCTTVYVCRAVLCVDNWYCQQQENHSRFTSLSCLHNFHHQHKFCKIIGETQSTLTKPLCTVPLGLVRVEARASPGGIHGKSRN